MQSKCKSLGLIQQELFTDKVVFDGIQVLLFDTGTVMMSNIVHQFGACVSGERQDMDRNN
jgi:hypothetical protein